MGVPQGTETDGEHPPTHMLWAPRRGRRMELRAWGRGHRLGRQSPQQRGPFAKGPALPRAPWWGGAHQPCVRACPYHLPAVTMVLLHL